MRIRQLHLKAFGPFTNQNLKFDSVKPGLHIIYGRNEAGKSSSLRGLKALLYGFPKQSRDNHLHMNAQLLVGGLLEKDGGDVLEFMRRKKNIADLRDREDNPLAPESLSTFLPGIDRGVFESLYAIDHEILVQGGRDLLAQKGEVGQALFAAGTGVLSLRRILEELDAEADQLFSPRATTKPLNRALIEHRTLKKSARTKSLSGRDWKSHRNRLKEAETSRTLLRKTLSERLLKQGRLRRLMQAIPQLKLREEVLGDLERIGRLRPLREDFSERVQKLVQDRLDMSRQYESAKLRLHSLQKEAGEIYLNQTLLDHAAFIPSLHQRLGEYKKGMKDRPRLDSDYHTCQSEARERLQRIQPDLPIEQIDRLRPVLHRKKRVQTLGQGYEALMLQVSENQKNLQKSVKEKESVEKYLKDLPPEIEIGTLAESLKLSMRAGELDEEIAENHVALEVEKQLCTDSLEGLGLWSGKLNDLSALVLPLPETVKGFEDRFDELDAIRSNLNRTHDESAARLSEIEKQLKGMSYAGEVPTEIELAEHREKRQAGWYLVRRAWLDQEDISEAASLYDSSCALPEAFESAMLLADQTSDRLRREADRIARFADLKSESEALKILLETNRREQSRLAESHRALEQSWLQLWEKSRIKALSPKEMLAWMTRIEVLRSRSQELERTERHLREQRNRRQLLSGSLRSDLKLSGERKLPTGDALRPLILCGESVLDILKENLRRRDYLEEKRRAIQNQLKEHEDALLGANTTLNTWQTKWKTALEELQLGSELSPSEASDILEDLAVCFAKLREAGDFASRIKGIDRDAADYEVELESLLKRIAPELIDQPLEYAVIQIYNMEKKAKQSLVLHEKNQAERHEVEERMTQIEGELKGFDSEMQAYAKEADCGSPEDLNGAILKWQHFCQCRDKLGEVEAMLLQLSEGEALEDTVEQAEGLQTESLAHEIDAIKLEVDETLNPEIDRLSEEIGDERLSLRQMDGSSQAAEAALAAQGVLAGIGRMANQYIRLKLASNILSEEIEHYRSTHQDPVLQLASSYFTRLTMDSFSEIRSDTNDKGVSILIGLRPDGRRLPVEAMSTGTRDQLYLSLRLAMVENRLKSGEAIPFIVDDILINFDDDRASATLRALAELGRKNQVILFTHHRQIVVEAGRIEGRGEIVVHELA